MSVQSKPIKQYFRVDEVADYFSISVRTVYRLIDEGELKRTKIRGCLRVPLWEIERYAKELEKQTEGV
jgi:excisionase family DNA binding protein